MGREGSARSRRPVPLKIEWLPRSGRCALRGTSFAMTLRRGTPRLGGLPMSTEMSIEKVEAPYDSRSACLPRAAPAGGGRNFHPNRLHPRVSRMATSENPSTTTSRLLDLQQAAQYLGV